MSNNYERLAELKAKKITELTLDEAREHAVLQKELLIPVIETTQFDEGPEVWRLDKPKDLERFAASIINNIDEDSQITFKFRAITPKEWGEIDYNGRDMA